MIEMPMIEMPDDVADAFREWCVDVDLSDMRGNVYGLGDFLISLHDRLGEFAVGLTFTPEHRRFADFLIERRMLRLWFDEHLMGALAFSAWKKVLSLHNPLYDLFMDMDSENIAGWRFAHVRKRGGDEVWYGEKGGGCNLQYIDVPDTPVRCAAPKILTFNQMRGCL